MKQSVLWRRPLGLALLLGFVFVTACGSPVVPLATSSPTTASSAAVAQSATTVTPSTTGTEIATASAVAEPSVVETAQSASATPTAAATTSPTATLVPTAAPTALPAPTATAAPTATPAPTQVALAPFDPALAAELQRILDQTVADGQIPGAVLSVSVAGQAPWNGASGVADRGQNRPMEPHTNVRIASISKIFTAVVVLQLAEAGVIDLDAPLARYVPNLVPNDNVITVRNLLNHTSGLYDYLEDRNFQAQAYERPERVIPPTELVTYATRFAPAFPPASANNWDYSSTNFVLLGMVVEAATGNSLAQEMRQRIFAPLGLKQTYFPSDEQVPPTAARGYRGNIDQTDVAMSFAFATANVVSTADEVRRFAEALVNGKLLQPAMLEQMFTFVNGKGQYNMPALEYGLGIMRNQLPVGPGPNGAARPPAASTVVGHIGGFAGFRSAVWSTPGGEIIIALGVNQGATDPNLLATRVFDAILTHQGR
ncbi:MAG: hypothetical protein CYG59_19780 [Chloroflexi bacterium]|nr:MAG: hypothetical protein CYG59_19780 [Chloroflexota bacterium]